MTQRRSGLAEWLIVGLLILITCSLAVSILPILPRMLTPQPMTVLVVATVIEVSTRRAVALAVWGGLVLDLLSASRFGAIWLPILVIALALIWLRRNPDTEVSALWPLWFAGASVLAALPFMVVANASWLAVGMSVFATIIWGIATVYVIRWVRASRVKYMRYI